MTEVHRSTPVSPPSYIDAEVNAWSALDYGYSFRYDRAELDAFMLARRRNQWAVS